MYTFYKQANMSEWVCFNLLSFYVSVSFYHQCTDLCEYRLICNLYGFKSNLETKLVWVKIEIWVSPIREIRKITQLVLLFLY